MTKNLRLLRPLIEAQTTREIKLVYTTLAESFNGEKNEKKEVVKEFVLVRNLVVQHQVRRLSRKRIKLLTVSENLLVYYNLKPLNWRTIK